MFLWFVGTAIVTVWFVFRDPRFDYRLLIVGSVLPLADGVTGGAARAAHARVQPRAAGRRDAVTVGRRPVRKLLLGLPIGTMLHLVFDGAWADTDLFWWPLGGWSLRRRAAAGGGAGLVGRALELVGLADAGVGVAALAPVRPGGAGDAFLHDGRLFTGAAP